nr:EthD domain-containing protein [Maritimibacter sp. DP1N21-5]
MTPAAFHAHWSGPHADIARELPDLVWYIQNHVIRPLASSPGINSTCDGIAEIAYGVSAGILDKIEGWDRVAELRADEARFLSNRLGCWSVRQEDSQAPSLRRVVAHVSEAEDVAVETALARIGQVVACHGERTVGRIDTPDAAEEKGEVPGWFLFAELPLGAGAADLLAPEGPILEPLALSGGGFAAYLTYTEAKRVPMDA